MRSFHWPNLGCESLLCVVRQRLRNDKHHMLSIVSKMLVYTPRAEISITWAVTTLVPPTDDVLTVTQGTRYPFVKGLAWLRNADLPQRVQG